MAATRVVRRGCARSHRRGGRAAHRPARVLDGRGRFRRGRRTSQPSRRSWASVDSGSARRQHAARKRLTVFHGARPLAAGPPACRRHRHQGFDRARTWRGRPYVLDSGALHGIALRSPWGKLIALPKAERWAELVEEELRRFVSSRWKQTAPSQLVSRRRLDVPYEPRALHRPDHPPRDVDLEAVEAVSCRRRESVMVVVPALAEHEERDDPVVARLVARDVVLAAEHVADRVHRTSRAGRGRSGRARPRRAPRDRAAMSHPRRSTR